MMGYMNLKIFSLQQRIGYTLLDKLENGEMTLARVTDISKKVLEVIPEEANENMFREIVVRLSVIPELRGLEFGL